MLVILETINGITHPGMEIAINTDWVVAVTPGEGETCNITVDGDSTPRYKVKGGFYEIVRKLQPQIITYTSP